MGNDIEIRVRVANNTASGLAAVNRSLNRLRDEARDAGRGLDGLTARATVASAALRGLKDSAQDAARALRSLNTAARTTDTRLTNLSDRSRTLRSDTDELDGSMRRLTGTLGQVQGNLGTIRTSGGNAGNSMNQLKKAALLLSPALIPIAAAATPIVAGLGAAAVAIGAFGLAIGGQIASMAKASEAQKKYKEAVKEHGKTSQEAAKAENDYLKTVRQMDPATRQAAAAFTVFKDEYKAWTVSLAGDTMPVVTKSFAVFGGLLPRLSPLIRGTSAELNRLMTVLAGGVNSAGFERLMSSFAEFASGALAKATDGLVRFMRTMSGGGGSSQFTEFLAYVREVGPQVGEALGNLSRALIHVVAAASDAGVGILSAVNAFAKLVNAIPTEVLSNLLQFVVVFKAVQLAAAGLGGAGGALAGFGASLAAMQAASVAAGGGLTGLVAAFNSLSRAAKVTLLASGIGILVVALSELSDMGKQAPPDVDKLTTSLRELGSTGKVTGEAAKAFGKDLDGLYDRVRSLTDPSTTDDIQQFIVTLGGLGDWDSTPVKDAKENIDAIDKALAGLVKNGQADLAAEALKRLTAEYGKGGRDTKEFAKNLDDYKAAIKDAKFEQQLAAQAMGLFGEQAQQTSAKLAEQKQSADGLRQAIQALNDVNRAGLGGMIAFEASIDAAAKAAQENAGALSMTHGVLDLNSEKAQKAATALQDLASKTDAAATSARESGSSWETVNGIYERGRAALMKNAQAMGLSRSEAAALADQILKIPNKTSVIKMNKEDAQRGLEAFNAEVKRTPSARKVTLQTLSKGAEAILEGFGLKVKRLPNGKVTVTAMAGQALSQVRGVKSAVDSLYSKSITITAHYRKDGASFLGASGRYAAGGKVRGYASGGDVQAYPDGGYVQGPGSGTSDDIVTMLGSGNVVRSSNTEFIVNARQTAKHRRLLELINSDQLPRFAKGGLTKRQKAAQAQAKAEREARSGARGDLTISHFGRMAGYKTSEIIGQLGRPDNLGSLVNALNSWRSIIMKSTHGGQEKSLLRALDSAGRKLLSWEKQLTKVSASLEKAKDKLDSLKSAASQLSDGVKSGVLSSANITRGASGEGPVTVASVMGGLTASRDKATSFSKALAALKKKGLSSTLLQQIAEAGIEGGGLETAGALLRASSSEIKSMNSLQSQIGGAASSAGKTTSDAVFGAQIKAQQAYVNMLTRSQGRLEKSMEKLAKSMEKLIEKAFKGKAAGGVIGAASGGARGSWTMVGEHEPELVRLPFGSRVYSGPDTRRKQQAAWTSMLNTPRGMRHAQGQGAAVGAGGGGRQVIEVVVNLDGRIVARQIIDPMRAEIAARGGSVQRTLGQGAG